MTSSYVLDSYAWVEYFRGTEKGETVRVLLENMACFTPAIVIAELSDKYAREKYDFWEQDLQFIIENSSIIDLGKEIAAEAGKIKQAVRKKYKNNFGLADAIKLSTAKKINKQVDTGELHFKKIKNVEFLK